MFVPPKLNPNTGNWPPTDAAVPPHWFVVPKLGAMALEI
jgi:hypothetical protein